MKRRMFLGAAGLGAVAATVGSAQNLESEEEDYRIRPTVSFGLGRGEAASMSVVWLPAQGREKLPPIKVVLVIFGLDGKRLVEKDVVIPPFSGASIDYERPAQGPRQLVFGYAFIEGFTDELPEEIFAGLEVYDVSSGKTNIAAAPVGVA